MSVLPVLSVVCGIIAAGVCVRMAVVAISGGHNGRGVAWIVTTPVAFVVGYFLFIVALAIAIVVLAVWVWSVVQSA